MINVIIFDEQEIFRTGLNGIFESTADIRVIEQTGEPRAALRMSESGRADVLILEPPSAGHAGIDFILQTRRRSLNLPILVLTTNRGLDFARRVLRAGASGYLLKSTSSSQVVEAVRKVAIGRIHVCKSIADNLIFDQSNSTKQPGHATLTTREMQVFLGIAKGESCKDIAQKLSLSSKTISTHKVRIKEKMKFSSAADFVLYAAAHKLIDPYVI